MTAIADNVARVRERIIHAAERAGRRASDITLVAVTKKQNADAVRAVLAAGVGDIGENYVQEAVAKRAELGDFDACWHLLGHLQSNKAATAGQAFDLIQSVDSIRLARRLAQLAADAGRVQPILLQVHLGKEATKTGLPPEQTAETAAQIAEMAGVRLEGLMGIAPLNEPARPHFQTLRRLFEQMPTAQQQILSMGMTADFETAIEEGATLVRIGTAIFGQRPN
ncbi:MAG: YggS family pyridoxal phosphate-dependent enzyme [Armatimonadota bacterium]|nr:YggS family pyridoxal phosphate-dependent enzyme [Armatimonadota bacterium]